MPGFHKQTRTPIEPGTFLEDQVLVFFTWKLDHKITKWEKVKYQLPLADKDWKAQASMFFGGILWPMNLQMRALDSKWAISSLIMSLLNLKMVISLATLRWIYSFGLSIAFLQWSNPLRRYLVVPFGWLLFRFYEAYLKEGWEWGVGASLELNFMGHGLLWNEDHLWISYVFLLHMRHSSSLNYISNNFNSWLTMIYMNVSFFQNKNSSTHIRMPHMGQYHLNIEVFLHAFNQI